MWHAEDSKGGDASTTAKYDREVVPTMATRWFALSTRPTRTFVGRPASAVVAALLVACSGGEGGLENHDATTERTPPISTPATPVPTSGTSPTSVTQPTPETTIAAGDHTVPTTTAGEQVTPAAWEPIDPASGRWLAFTSERTGSRELFAIDVGTGDERQLTDQVTEIYQPAWSPDGSMIAFQCPNAAEPTDPDSGLGPTDICAVAVDTGEIVRLTDDAAPDQRPTWSPDSSQVAFITIDDDGARVRSAEVSGSEPRLVAEGLAPAWSPDGSELAVVGITGELAVVDVASGERRPLTDTGTPSANPAWSPDGTAIAFACADGEPDPEDLMPRTDICVIAADGTARRSLADGGSIDSDPAWSPDGTAIAFTSGEFLIAGTEIIVAPAAGGSPRAIGSGYSPVWSPDGRSLAIVAGTGGIQLIDGETGDTSVVSVDSTVGALTWAPIG